MEWIKSKFGNKEPVFVLLILLLFGLIGGTIGSFYIARQMQDITPSIYFLILLEAVGTLTTLLFIWTTVKEGRIERKKERLRQQLQFYSPLVGRIHREDYQINWKNTLIDEIMAQNQVNTNYELFAENELANLLREFFKGKVRTADEYTEFGDSFKSIVLLDFEKLRAEYLSI